MKKRMMKIIHKMKKKKLKKIKIKQKRIKIIKYKRYFLKISIDIYYFN